MMRLHSFYSLDREILKINFEDVLEYIYRMYMYEILEDVLTSLKRIYIAIFDKFFEKMKIIG